MPVNKKKIEKAIKEILSAIGDNPHRPELLDTPRRVAEMYEEIFSDCQCDPAEVLSVTHEHHGDQMIILKDIQFHSICEHHLIPFFGNIHIIYVPKDNRITGFSKLCRLVECVSKRPQLQERMGTQIADAIMKKLEPHGVMVVMEAEHLCMSMRGVKKPGIKTITSAIRGIFYSDASAREEALALIKQS